MRKTIPVSAMVLAVGVIAMSCAAPDNNNPGTQQGRGIFKISEIRLSGADEVTDPTRSAAAVDGFAMTVADSEGRKVIECLCGQREPENELPEGSYTIEIESHRPLEAEWEKPYYFAGREFTVRSGEATIISEIVCELSNIMATVEFSENMMGFIGDGGRVDISVGGATLTYNRGAEVKVESPNTEYACAGKAGYFKAPAAENTLTWKFTGTIDGAGRESSGTINKVRAGQHRKLKFDIARGTGVAELVFTVSVECQKVEIKHNVCAAVKIPPDLIPPE